MSDRLPVIPSGSTNLAMISRLVEVPGDIVFTEEYPVYAARIVVYELLSIGKKLCPATSHHKNPKALAAVARTMPR